MYAFATVGVSSVVEKLVTVAFVWSLVIELVEGYAAAGPRQLTMAWAVGGVQPPSTLFWLRVTVSVPSVPPLRDRLTVYELPVPLTLETLQPVAVPPRVKSLVARPVTAAEKVKL